MNELSEYLENKGVKEIKKLVGNNISLDRTALLATFRLIENEEAVLDRADDLIQLIGRKVIVGKNIAT